MLEILLGLLVIGFAAWALFKLGKTVDSTISKIKHPDRLTHDDIEELEKLSKRR
jgi:hypothetical protein